MKILVIANSNNIWVHSFIKNVISHTDDVYVLYSGSLKPEYKKSYQKRRAVILGNDKLIYKPPKLGSWIRRKDYCKEILKQLHFDRCIILNTTSYRLSIWNSVKSIIDKTAVLYWGSDIHRVDKDELLKQKKYLDNVDDIVFTAENLKHSFMTLYPESYLSKISVIQFGLESLDYIDNVCRDYMQNAIKEELNIPTGKDIIAIGYCGIPEQQHLRIIDELSGLSGEQKEQICVMLQFMYNITPAYRKQIIDYLENTDINYVVFDRFMTPPELAKLRCATDIFINAQTTDALAGSVLETVYAGGKLINGKWLNYPEMKEWGIQYWEFEDFSSLKDRLIEVISANYQPDSNSKNKLKSTMSWKRCRKQWQGFFDGEKKQLNR